jgi:hypothetical protein
MLHCNDKLAMSLFEGQDPEKFPSALLFNLILSGRQLGCDDPVQIVWLAHLRIQSQTPILIMENVAEQPLEFVRHSLPGWHIHRLVVSPKNVGYKLICRTRAYTVCINPRRAELVADLYAVWGQVPAS